jgi:anti-sigma B factor antagonist
MELRNLDDDLVNVKLAGRLDTPGVDRIELRLTATLVPAGKNAVVDLSAVQLVTSMGIRMFITLARSLKAKKARMALYAPQALVRETFANVALGHVLPICDNETDAVAAIRVAV